MPQEIRVGLVGCGRAAERLHLPALARVEGVRAVALADPDPARLAAVAPLAPDARTYADADALIAAPDIDLVAVCAPPAHHAPLAIAALAAGRHVYLEKPVAVSWDQAMAIADAAAAAPGVLTMGLNLRSHRLVRQAAAVLASGALGPVEVIRTTWTSGYHRGGAWPAWRDARAEGGGALFEIAVHHLDLCRHLLGEEIVRVSVEAAERDVADQTVAIAGRASGGALLSMVAAQRTADANEIEIFGRDGALRFSLYRGDSLQVRRAADAAGLGARARGLLAAARRLPPALAAARGGGDFLLSYAAHWQAAARAARGDAPPPATLDDGLRALAAVLAAVESADSGAPAAPAAVGA